MNKSTIMLWELELLAGRDQDENSCSMKVAGTTYKLPNTLAELRSSGVAEVEIEKISEG